MIFILSVIIVVLDQLTKYNAIKYLKTSNANVIIPNFLKLTYIENFGAAFGILQNRKWLFIIITFAVIIYISLIMWKNYHKMNSLIKIGVGMLVGGAIGNFIDRVRFGYVVDFISFRLFNKFNFPVFNIADTFIVIGTIIILALVLFDKCEI